MSTTTVLPAAMGAARLPAQSAEAGNTASLLWRVAIALALAAVPTALCLALDDRMLGHFNVWTKPLKFQLALAVQTATLAWALRHLSPALRRIAMPRWLGIGWSVVAVYEASFITLQGARGVASHFNRATPWESIGGTLMAAGAGVLVLVTVWIGLVALWHARQRQWAAMPLAIGLGFIAGGVLAAWTGGAMGAVRGYWPQPLVEPVQWMPLTGWVLSQTDLRIAHFVGLHQMQMLPAIAAVGVLARWRPRVLRITLCSGCLAAIAVVVVLGAA
ncbi:MAG: hypothetical protein EOO25_16895 [Comamonadaceae bacterium]|nr:MAG: hypothetical protein EOO25_16895 [Comamonadaceae bacterium]